MPARIFVAFDLNGHHLCIDPKIGDDITDKRHRWFEVRATVKIKNCHFHDLSFLSVFEDLKNGTITNKQSPSGQDVQPG